MSAKPKTVKTSIGEAEIDVYDGSPPRVRLTFSYPDESGESYRFDGHIWCPADPFAEGAAIVVSGWVYNRHMTYRHRSKRLVDFATAPIVKALARRPGFLKDLVGRRVAKEYEWATENLARVRRHAKHAKRTAAKWQEEPMAVTARGAR